MGGGGVGSCAGGGGCGQGVRQWRVGGVGVRGEGGGGWLGCGGWECV